MRIHRHRINKPKYKIQDYRVNERIKASQVRLIDEEGNMVGVVPIEKALEIADEKELDLVEVFPKADPPVCKILDYGSFKYQKEKEAKKQKKASKSVYMKGIRLSVRIGEHDFNLRISQAKKFIERGDKIKIEMIVRGREKAHPDVAKGVLNRFVESLKEQVPIKVEQPISKAGNRFIMILAPSVDNK